MRIFEEPDEFGNTMYCVSLGGETLSFPSPGEREKFLFRLFMDWLEKMLRSQLLLEALERLHLERGEGDMQEVMVRYFSIFVGFLLPLDNYFYGLPNATLTANQAYLQAVALDFAHGIIDLILQVSPPAPARAPRTETFEEALARTRAAKAAKNNTTDKPRG